MTVHISKATRIVPRLTALQLGWEPLMYPSPSRLPGNATSHDIQAALRSLVQFSSGILHEEASRAVGAYVLHR